MTSSGERLRQKKQFYDDIAAIHSDQSQADLGHQNSMQAWRKSQSLVSTPAKGTFQRTVLARSVSDNTSDVSAWRAAKDPYARPVATAPNQQPTDSSNPSTLTKSMSAFPPALAPEPLNGKRKRESTVGLVSEGQQIFRSLRFYFFPNNKNNGARRMRITKAQQHGATWEQHWSDQVTHVILDKTMSFTDLLKYLKLGALPDSIIAVSEDYPAECLSYMALLDPGQARFACKGSALSTLRRTKSSDSDKSLQLKPPRKAQAHDERETESDQTYVPTLAYKMPNTATILKETKDDSGDIADDQPMPDATFDEEFEEAIRKAKTLQHLPLDDDHGDGDSRPSTADGQESGNLKEQPALKLLKQSTSKIRQAQDKFSCMQKHTADDESSNPNQATIDILQQMADFYAGTGDEWRTRAYRKTISTLRLQTTKICTKEQAAALPNVGSRLAEKIEEIVMTSRLRRLDNAKVEPTDGTLRLFMGIYGAGIVKATQWVDQGYKTLDDLLKGAELTANQRIGIERYEDFNSRIPRAEVERHGNVVRAALQEIDSAFRVIVGGSYRRGAKDSGDIDCIITREDTGADYLRNAVLGQLIPSLTERGFLVANLAVTSREDGSKWHGASCLPESSIWRRLDLLLVPSDEFGAALIYFTGNDIFCRSLRLLASAKGMRLNQRGLYRDVLRGPKRSRLTEGTLVEGKDEKKIFEALGVPWRPPEHRIC